MGHKAFGLQRLSGLEGVTGRIFRASGCHLGSRFAFGWDWGRSRPLVQVIRFWYCGLVGVFATRRRAGPAR